jgi:FkbM family methyltransferase
MSLNPLQLIKAVLFFPAYIFKAYDKTFEILRKLQHLQESYDRLALTLGVDEFKSQYGQDILVDRLLKQKREGFFLELGAYDPVHLSNTYFLEKNRGWRGLLVEAQPDRKQLLERHRSNSIVESHAISDEEKEISFTVADAISGIDDTMLPQHMERVSDLQSSSIRLKTVTLQSLLDKHRIQKIDYFSLDVEGAELQVLRSIDFSKVRIDVITVEIDYPERMKDIHEHLALRGFKLLGYVSFFKFIPLASMEYRGSGDYIFRNSTG